MRLNTENGKNLNDSTEGSCTRKQSWGGAGVIGMESRIGGCGQISWCSSHGK